MLELFFNDIITEASAITSLSQEKSKFKKFRCRNT